MNTSFFSTFNQTVDPNRMELIQHGDESFPCAAYTDHYSCDGYPWHWHDELEFGYVAEGELQVSVNEYRYVLHAGDGIFINAGVLHAYSSAGKCTYPNIVLRPLLLCGSTQSVFWQKYLRPLLETVHISHVLLHTDIPWQSEILEHIRGAHTLLETAEWGYEFRVRNSLSEAILLLIGQCESAADIPHAHVSSELQRVRQMLDFIQCHYTEHIPLSQIADAASISTRECLRCFQKVLGIPPKRYVCNLRLQRACTLLTDSTLSLAEIAVSCGFQSQSYFTKAFRESLGCTPGVYRATKRNENL